MAVKNNELEKNLLLLLITIILFLTVSEIIFRVVYNSILIRDTWWKEYDLEWYNEHLDEEYSRHLINYDIQKGEGVFRIAILGDSYAFGFGEENGLVLRNETVDKSYPKFLETFLNNNFDDYEYEVLNFAWVAVSALEMSYILEDYVVEYNPDLVIIQIADNDRYTAVFNIDPFVYCDIEVSLYERIVYRLKRTFRLLDYILTENGYASYYYYEVYSYNSEKRIGERCFVKSLQRIDSLLSGGKGGTEIPSLIFYFYELGYSPDTTDFNEYYNPDMIAEVNKTFTSIGFDVLYTNDYLFDIDLDQIYGDDLRHFNEKGNIFAATIIYNYLLNNSLVPSCESQECTPKLLEVGPRRVELE